MKKKNWFLVIIIFSALLIAIVIWIYAKRIEDIENKINTTPVSISTKAAH